MNDIKTAAQALVDKLDIALAKLDDAIKIATIHGHAYYGPQFSHELNNLKTALERDKAIDELVKHDQEIGLYDEWGEPFYGSPEIAEYLGFIKDVCWWDNVDKLWIILVFIGDIGDYIYSLPAKHPFYETYLFANAQKPDADHPCREG